MDIKDNYSIFSRSSHSHDAFGDDDAPTDDTSQVSYVKYRNRTTLQCESARSICFLYDNSFLGREIWWRRSSVD